MLTFNFCHPKQFSRAFIADLKEELEKEKESQNAIRKRIEEETKVQECCTKLSQQVSSFGAGPYPRERDETLVHLTTSDNNTP